MIDIVVTAALSLTRDGYGNITAARSLNRVLEAEEERLESGADSAAFHANVLQLFQDHKNEMAVPISAVTEPTRFTPKMQRVCMDRQNNRIDPAEADKHIDALLKE